MTPDQTTPNADAEQPPEQPAADAQPDAPADTPAQDPDQTTPNAEVQPPAEVAPPAQEGDPEPVELAQPVATPVLQSVEQGHEELAANPARTAVLTQDGLLVRE